MSNLVRQFLGSEMKDLIGGPLGAAADAGLHLAESTSRFIEQAGLDGENKVRTVTFKYHQTTPDPDGHFTDNEMAVDLPLLSVVPIPNLRLDEVRLLFDMEVKGSGKSSTGAGRDDSAVTVWGCVSSGQNARVTDHSAKYHVDIHASNHGATEGLARVLDIMVSAAFPKLLSSRAVDEAGRELQGDAKERNSRIKALQKERLRLEEAERSAKEDADIMIKILTEKAQELRFQGLNGKGAHAENDTSSEYGAVVTLDEEEPVQDTAQTTEKYREFWDGFDSGLQVRLGVYAETGEEGEDIQTLYGEANEAEGIPDLSGLNEEFKEALKAVKEWKKTATRLRANKSEYNAMMMQ